jgi:microcystin-dependent protein
MTTSNKGLDQPAYNSNVNTWGIGPINDNFGLIDLALGGSTLLNATGLGGTTVALSAAQCVPLSLVVSGTPGGIVTYTVPSGVGGQWIVRNGTTGGYAVRVESLAGGTYVSIAAGENTPVSCDGTASGVVRSNTTSPSAAGSNTQLQYNSSGVLGASANLTFDGTTLGATGLNITGSTVLGDAAGDILTITGTAVTIPNGLNIGSNNLYLNGTGQVGIGTTTVGSDKLVVAGTIKSTSGGIVFPDGSTQTTAATLPTGSVIPFAVPVAPSGFLLCAGQAVLKASYPALDTLFSASSYPYGSTLTTFTLPDLRGRVVAGADNMNGSAAGVLTSATMSPDGNTVGATGGTQQVTLATSQIPPLATGVGTVYTAAPFGPVVAAIDGVSGSPVYLASVDYVAGPHLNAQPTAVMYYVIKT